MNSVQLAANLYNIRDTAKRLHKANYQAKVEPYIGFIQACKTKHSLKTDILAAMKLVEDCKDIEGAGAAQLLIWSALLEILEK